MTKATLIVFAGLALALLAAPASAARILLDPAVEGDPAYGFASGELAAVSGIAVTYGTESQAGDVVVGGSSPAVTALLASGRLSLPAQIKADGFAIRQLDGLTVVAGADVRGDLYGALWLAERTLLDPKALRSLECVREPAFALREFADGWGHREPPGRGYGRWLQECLRLGVNTDSTLWSHSHLGAAQSYHVDTYTGTKPFECLPVPDLIARYGDEVSESPGQLCPLKPKVWEIYREHLRERLRSFPEVDFILICLSDFAEEYYVYGCRGPACRDLPDAEAIRLAIQAAWDVVVSEFDKTLLISGWGNPPDTYALNVPESYRYIVDRLPERGVITIHDNTQHDFYLTSPFNPVLGAGNRPQSIMFQVTREYSGQGFVPVYIGPMLRERMARFQETGLAHGARGRLWVGAGLWTRDVLWTRANMYAFFRATWEPQGDPWEWARDWAALTFGPQGAGELAEALCLSEEVARRSFRVHGYSGAKAHAYAITHRNVFTDGTHYYRWDSQPHLTAYRQNQMRGKVRAALAEAEGALALRDRMMERWRAARALMANAELRDACDRDFEHFSALAEVLNLYECAMLLWCQSRDEGIATEDRCWAARECVKYTRRTLAAYRHYWAEFAKYPETVFRDSGMTEMLAVYLRDCAALAAHPDTIAAEPGKPALVALSVFNNGAPDGLSATVKLHLPDGWTAGPERQVELAYGGRMETTTLITLPPDAPQGDAQISARLAASDGSGEIETAAIQVKVIGLSGAIAESGQPTRVTTICPRASRAPQVDGAISPGEWPGAAPAWVNYPVTADMSTEENTFAVEARWMWDDRNFYVAWLIADDVLQPVVGRSIHRGDVEGVAFDLDGDRRDDYAIRLLHTLDGYIAWPKTMNGTLTSSKFYDRAKVEPLGRSVVLATGERPGRPGRVVEAAIPWSLLGGFKPGVSKVIGFAINSSDADTPGRARAFLGWPPARPERTGPIGSWVRPDRPTDFADLVFTR